MIKVLTTKDLNNKGMSQIMDSIHDHSTPKKRKSKTMQKVPYQLHQSPKQERATTDSNEKQKKYWLTNKLNLGSGEGPLNRSSM